MNDGQFFSITIIIILIGIFSYGAGDYFARKKAKDEESIKRMQEFHDYIDSLHDKDDIKNKN